MGETAPAAVEKLNKILRLEASQGCRNRAVIGGMETFADVWQAEAEAEAGNEAEATQVRQIADQLRSYAAADREERIRTVSSLLNLQFSLQGRPAGSDMPPGPEGPAAEEVLYQSEPALAAADAGEGQPEPRPERPVATPGRPPSGLEAPVSTLPGVKAVYESRLKHLGIHTVGDLLYHFPHRYDDYRTLKPISRLEYGEETTIIGVVWETSSRKTRSGKPIISSIIADGSGTMEAIWFNQPYLEKQLRAGRRIVLSGKVDEYLGRLVLQSPVWEPLERELVHTGRLVPIYRLSSGLSARWMRQLIKRVVDHWAPRQRDFLPKPVRDRAGLMDLAVALRQMHFPDSMEDAREARRRLSFDEFLMVQLGLLQQRRSWRSQQGTSLLATPENREAFLSSLPFPLTDAQRRSLAQISEDLEKPQPMSRLLQGDVGSGKTVIAAAAMLSALASGKQAALMVPTEILAEQHHRTLGRLYAPSIEWDLGRPISVVLLTGSLPRMERAKALAAAASGHADIVVGTHALIQKRVEFKDLALIVVDEQHRFGVAQRAALKDKGIAPHVLVMSATPIPRSLALTVYGDLDISVIDELPPGRQTIETRWLLPRERERAYAFLRNQVEKGFQAFILYPLIEESAALEARAAVAEYERLREKVFPDLRLGLIHGRMKAKEKDEVMTRFRDGEIQILVSTSVIEVGIDVPNATVMLIEGADRFGLAQLHQFRGRVGRGGQKSFCLLLSDNASPDDPQTQATWERLKAIEETQDGFLLAEKDLELRGPGDFLGVRQSGLPSLRLASLSDIAVLEQARHEAAFLFEADPTLDRPEHRLLADRLAQFWHATGPGAEPARQGDLS